MYGMVSKVPTNHLLEGIMEACQESHRERFTENQIVKVEHKKQSENFEADRLTPYIAGIDPDKDHQADALGY